MSALHGFVTLLLVDDEPMVLSALRRALRHEGYRILTATNGHEAIAVLERAAVDILVSDIDMPHMSGIELVSQVRRTHPDVVRILLTGRGSMESALRAINDGEVFRYLTKPWVADELRETLAQAAGRLVELRRQVAADRTATWRRTLFAELEEEHPGIAEAVRDDEGAYVTDGERVRRAAAAFPALAALLDE